MVAVARARVAPGRMVLIRPGACRITIHPVYGAPLPAVNHITPEGAGCAVAKPDKDDGYFTLAYELTAAVLTRRFSDDERIVLFEAFAQVYGWAKHPLAVLSATSIARRTGKDKANILKAIRNLVKAGVLIKVSETTYRFNKDHERWTLPGESPERRQASISYALHAPTLVKAYRNDDHPTVVGGGVYAETPYQRSSGVCGDTLLQLLGVWGDTPGVYAETPPPALKSASEANPPLSTPPERACVARPRKNLMENSIENLNPLLPREVGGEENTPRGVSITPDPETPTATPDPPGLLPSAQGAASAPVGAGDVPPPTNPSDVASLHSWAVAVLGDRFEREALAGHLVPWCQSYPVAWVREALERARVGAREGGAARYANQCLLRWHATGQTESEALALAGAARAAANGTPPPPPRKTYQERLKDQSEAMKRAAARIAAMEDLD